MRTFTARQAAERYKVRRTTVHMWHTRGWITPTGQRRHLTAIGTNDHGARLYPEHELIDAEQHTRSKQQRSHRASRKLVAA